MHSAPPRSPNMGNHGGRHINWMIQKKCARIRLRDSIIQRETRRLEHLHAIKA